MEPRSDLFLPEPSPREVKYTVISVDDHVVEPKHTFEGRLPAHLADRAPRIVENEFGHEVWDFEGETYSQVGMNAVAGRPKSENIEPCRFEEMRPGCYDPDARVSDMDINGVWAAVNFPSMITGFCGRVFFNANDPELGQACVRAWNDWIYEEWFSAHPTRIIPLGIAFLSDPAAAVAEIHRNAERGFTALSVPEMPHNIGLPSLWDRDHWNPILEACVDTETVLSMHVGSSGGHDIPAGAPGLHLGATLFGQMSLSACAQWLWSGYPNRYPDLKIAMSEGGIGWVAMLLDRLDNIVDRAGFGVRWDERPADILKRNFWFCTIDDPSTIDTRHRIGVENIMLECDFPHGDGTWPDTQLVIEKEWGHIPNDEVRKMCCENASALYRHPLPDIVLPQIVPPR
jgi:predicted TIM-barrel fold metal-dependent hydrolase